MKGISRRSSLKVCRTIFRFFFVWALCATVFAQGTMLFSNRNVPHPAGDGTMYDIPAFGWSWDHGGWIGAGSLPGGARAALYLASDLSTPLAQSTFRSDEHSQFFATASQTVAFPLGNPAGSTPSLVLRVWQDSSLSYEQSRDAGNVSTVVSFVSRPLGGTPPGGDPILPPGMNFGTESSGLRLVNLSSPEPTAISLLGLGFAALALKRRN